MQDPNVWPEAVTDDLKLTIEDWFDNREVVDNYTFDIYFRRIINRDLSRYLELLRIEPGYAKYDWLVNRYTERMTWGDDHTTESADSKTTYGQNIERSKGTTTNGESTQNGGSYHEHTQYGGSDSTEAVNKKTDTTTSNTPGAGTITSSDSSAVAKDNPYSVSYSNAEAGKIPALDWQTTSTQSQTDGVTTVTYDGNSDTGESHTTESGGDKHTYGQTVDRYGEGSKTDTTKTSVTGSDTDKYSGSDTTEGGRKQDHQNTDYLIDTGRTGDISELLSGARSFIEKTSAWAWFQNRLEVCFLGVYEW